LSLPANCSALNLPLETSRLVLRSFQEGDFEDTYILCSHPDICRYIRPPMTREQVVTHIADRMQPWTFEEEKWYSLTVKRKGASRVIGEVVFRLESIADRRAEIGYRFHPDAQGKGYALEANKALVALLFRVLDLHKLVAYCHSVNAASRRLLTRLGFTEEGCKRDHMFSEGKWLDLTLYGLINKSDEGLSREMIVSIDS